MTRPFCWHQNFVTWGAVCHCPGAIHIHVLNHEKNCVKSYLKRDFFLNLQQTTKVRRCSCWHQNFVPKGLSAPASGLYTVQDKGFFTSPLAPACSGVQWKGLKFYIPPWQLPSRRERGVHAASLTGKKWTVRAKQQYMLRDIPRVSAGGRKAVIKVGGAYN